MALFGVYAAKNVAPPSPDGALLCGTIKCSGRAHSRRSQGRLLSSVVRTRVDFIGVSQQQFTASQENPTVSVIRCSACQCEASLSLLAQLAGMKRSLVGHSASGHEKPSIAQ
jgi:hypothetical protein